MELLKSLFLGILEGITEWLPVSSTGHLLLCGKALRLEGSEGFREIFLYVIQLGAALAAALLYRKRFSFFQKKEPGAPFFSALRKDAVCLWGKIALACVPGAAAALFLDKEAEKYFDSPAVIALALIFYGLVFLWIEPLTGKRKKKAASAPEIGWRTAFFIGLFQVLSIVPGTSRSGATILGALILGAARPAAAEFSFLMALPVMAGMSAIKIFQNGVAFSASEWLLLCTGTLSAFLTSLFTIRFLIGFVKKHSFAAFGVYRILLGGAVLLFLA